jgi:hypothetical protein
MPCLRHYGGMRVTPMAMLGNLPVLWIDRQSTTLLHHACASPRPDRGGRNAKRGTGILNNELYMGRLVRNRLRYAKDPDTGKRVSRSNPSSAWVTAAVPQLRIVDDDLWHQVKAWQAEMRRVTSNGNPKRFNQTRRPKSPA